MGLQALEDEIVACRACPRLVEWREQVAVEKRAAYRDETYWGRPIPGFGDPAASLMILGLAPAAHGANRTGRVFTGDRSGDFLFAGLHRAGYANQPESVHADDGLALTGAWISAAVRCAPPANKPTPQERDACLPFAIRELGLLTELRVILCLGGFAWAAVWRILEAQGLAVPRPRPKFGHEAEVDVDRFSILGCFHPSQQNTFTGRMTPAMLDERLMRVRALCRTDGEGIPQESL